MFGTLRANGYATTTRRPDLPHFSTGGISRFVDIGLRGLPGGSPGPVTRLPAVQLAIDSPRPHRRALPAFQSTQ